MYSTKKRLARERLTMSKMVGIYCAAHHDSCEDSLCGSCREFLRYAEVRLQKCPYGEDKPTCANCPVHCYKPTRLAQARKIMRFAGPRMLLRHPLARSCDSQVPECCCAIRYSPLPTSWTDSERLNTRVNSHASKECGLETGDLNDRLLTVRPLWSPAMGPWQLRRVAGLAHDGDPRRTALP